jgi:hypothetical protein
MSPSRGRADPLNQTGDVSDKVSVSQVHMGGLGDTQELFFGNNGNNKDTNAKDNVNANNATDTNVKQGNASGSSRPAGGSPTKTRKSSNARGTSGTRAPSGTRGTSRSIL